MGFSLFSSPFSFRDPDQSCDCPPLKSLPGYFRSCPSALQIFSGYFGNFPSAPKSLQDIFGTFPSAPKSFQDILEAFRPPLKSFQDILDKFLENNFPFSLQHEFLIKLSQTNFHLLEFVCGYKSSFTPVIRPLDSDCGFCLSCAVFEQLSQLLS